MPIDPDSDFGKALNEIVDTIETYNDNIKQLRFDLNDINKQINDLQIQKDSIEKQLVNYEKLINNKYSEMEHKVKFKDEVAI